jgi:hypothetical protein
MQTGKVCVRLTGFKAGRTSLPANGMAIYHLSVKTVSRSKGRSAVAAAAYRSGTVLVNEQDRIKHDYSRRRDVVETFIVAPPGSPPWAFHRESLWNAAEEAETRINSTTAREVELNLPHELDPEDRLALAERFARVLSERYGVAVDCSLHAPHRRYDPEPNLPAHIMAKPQRPEPVHDKRNFHAHFLLTTRIVNDSGLGGKTRVLDAKKTGPVEVKAIRKMWEDMANEALDRAGHSERIDRRSNVERGLLNRATIHEGYAAREIEARGEHSERCEINRQIKASWIIEPPAASIKRKETARVAITDRSADVRAAGIRVGGRALTRIEQLAYLARTPRFGGGPADDHLRHMLTWNVDDLRDGRSVRELHGLWADPTSHSPSLWGVDDTGFVTPTPKPSNALGPIPAKQPKPLYDPIERTRLIDAYNAVTKEFGTNDPRKFAKIKATRLVVQQPQPVAEPTTRPTSPRPVPVVASPNTSPPVRAVSVPASPVAQTVFEAVTSRPTAATADQARAPTSIPAAPAKLSQSSLPASRSAPAPKPRIVQPRSSRAPLLDLLPDAVTKAVGAAQRLGSSKRAQYLRALDNHDRHQQGLPPVPERTPLAARTASLRALATGAIDASKRAAVPLRAAAVKLEDLSGRVWQLVTLPERTLAARRERQATEAKHKARVAEELRRQADYDSPDAVYNRAWRAKQEEAARQPQEPSTLADLMSGKWHEQPVSEPETPGDTYPGIDDPRSPRRDDRER